MMSAVKKILLVHPFAQEISGPDRSILAVIKHLQGNGYHYDVVLPALSPFTPEYEKLGCKLYYYPMSIIKRRLDVGFVLGYIWRFIPTVLFLIRLIKKLRPDLVHTNGAVILGSGIAAKICRVPSIYHIRCTAIAHPEIVASIVTRIIAWSSSRIVSISNACALPFGKRGFASQVQVVYNGIEVELFLNSGDRKMWHEELNLSEEIPVIGQVGRFGPDKGFLEFAKVCSYVSQKIPEVHFVAVGSPFRPLEQNYLELVQREVKKLGIYENFHFVGQRDDIPAVMSGFNVFVTMAKEEGLGRVAIEAMAAGIPVVANNVHGLCEVVLDGKTGFLAGPNNPQETAERIIQLLQDRELCINMAQAAREHAMKNFSSETCAQKTAAVYEDVLRTC